MAGFVPCVPLDETVDDLTSSYFNTNKSLGSLRRAVTGLIQDSEDMVSRAIINALSEDNKINGNNTCDSIFCGEFPSVLICGAAEISAEIQANILFLTFEWTKLYTSCAPRPDFEEQKRLFLQKHMFAIFVHVHNRRLTEDDAVRTLLDIATLLDIPIWPSVQRERDTLIIQDQSKEIYLDTLSATMKQFDELCRIGVATNRNFAFCRFASARGPLKAFAAADKGSLDINGNSPQLSLIQKPLVSGRPGTLSRRSISVSEFRERGERNPRPKPIHARRKSHQRNTISIDKLITESPIFHRMINDPVLVSPIDVESFQKKDNFGKIYDIKDFRHSSDAIATISVGDGIHDTSNGPQLTFS
ncbi:unnamed protein product [Pseudo-nitzschia multistriata]|uniref:Uncharacterized protein n=1 Tax=Pseudo-nitzschia multistriata TaxID=183589 RepID=A0A448ZRU2_9STRA|nr:unnamed protein product [Pseudo-nitzschia multistriata]